MRLLVVTQAVDTEDPVLGFFIAWLFEFAKRFDSLEVISLRKGKNALPDNVRIHSFGERVGSRQAAVSSQFGRKIRYAWRFLWLAWKLRNEYDAVFVHMNQEYVLIAGWLWKLLGKKVYMWRNHYAGSLATDIAAAFCMKIFCTSKHSYTAKFGKTVFMPVGVDTARFAPDARIARTPRSILFLSRMAPSKRPDMLIEALALIAEDGLDFSATFVGSPLPKDEPYYAALKERVRAHTLQDRILFKPGVPNSETPDLYRAHEIFVNASPSGMFDKTLFEAAASGCMVLAASADFAALAGESAHFDSAAELAARLKASLGLVPPALLAGVAARNSLETLAARLSQELGGNERPGVLFLINKLKTGGSEKLFREECAALEADGYRAYLAPLYGTETPEGVSRERTFFPTFRGLADVAAYARLIRFVRREQIGCIHATLEHASVAARIAGLFLPGARIAISEPGMADRKPLRYRILDVLLNFRTDVIIAGSENVRASLVRYQPLHARKMVIVMNGVSVPERLPARHPDEGFIALAVGSLRAEKDFATLIRAFALFCKTGADDATLVIVGKGSLGVALAALAREQGIAERVLFAGELSEDAVAKWYGRASCLVVSSVSEGGPFVVLEAMAAGVPVIATAVGCVPEVVEDGVTGLIVRPGDAGGIAAALERLHADTELRARLARAGFARVADVGTFGRHMKLLKEALALV